MKSPKAVTSAIVAAALAGGIGLAFAQTSDQGSPGGNAALNPAPAANSSADTMATPAPTPGTDTAVQTERPAQADRN
ncbi:MAG: hypothetical protein V4454_21565 [Pseudomonadota bacterium]